jgi:hypothetical protein
MRVRVGQINPLQGHSDPIGDVREVASMEGRDWVESLGGLEVAAAQGGKSNTSRSTLLRIFMRGMGGSLSLRGGHFTWQAKRGGENTISHNR